MGRPSNTTERREQIADALIRLLGTRGYDGASTVEIAREARLAPGLVHYHFESKAEILHEAIRRLGALVRARAASRLEAAGSDPRKRLDAWIDALLARGEDADADAVGCWVDIASQAARDPAARRVYREAVGALRRQLERLLRPLMIRSRVCATATGLLAAIEGYYLLASAAPGLVPDGTAAATVRRFARAGGRP